MAVPKRPGYKTPISEMYKDPERYSAAIGEYEEDLKTYRRLAKRADQRLVRLEALSHEENYRDVKQWAYAEAMQDIHRYSGKEAKRFNQAPPTTLMELEGKINAIKRFLQAPSSSKSGITKIYQKRANSINKKFGTKFTWQEMANYYKSGLAEKFDKEYGSATALFALAKIKKRDLKEIEDIKAMSEKHQVVPEDQIGKVVEDMLNKYSADILAIYEEE